MKINYALLWLGSFLGLTMPWAGVSADDGPPPPPPAPCDVDHVDWSQATLVQVHMTYFVFEPKHLEFEYCKPYRLQLTKHGNHTFTAKEFFNSIYIKQPLAGGAAPADFSEIEPAASPRDGIPEILFVPTQLGSFPLKCSEWGHAQLGMRGKIDVELVEDLRRH